LLLHAHNGIDYIFLAGADAGFLEGGLTQGSNLWDGLRCTPSQHASHAGTRGFGACPTQENF